MFLFVGLGNPGSGYSKNRHNVGFMAVDAITHRHNFSPYKEKFQGHISDGILDKEKILVLKPMTYMNRSGQAVREAQAFYKIPTENIVVFHDELDLAPGKVRVKTGGGIAGHNGLRDIRSHCGENFQRVRIGIGRPGDKSQVHNYVLSDFSKAEENWLPSLMNAIAEYSPHLVQGEESKFMNDVALKANIKKDG